MSENEQEFSFKKLFVPLTTLKVIHWIVIIGFLVFGNGLFNSFVLDDQPQITANPIVQSFTNFPLFFSGGTFFSGSGQASGFSYKPIMTLSFALNYALGGGNSFPFHLFQITLYIINAVLVFLVLKQIIRVPIAFFLSLLFLVHPINSESAFYIADTQEVLFFFFGILAIHVLQKYQTTYAFITASLLLLLSLLSKETGVLFVFTATIYLFLFKRNHLKSFLLCLALPIVAYIILRLSNLDVLTHTAVYAPIYKLDLIGRMINIPAIFFFYSTMLFFPKNLSLSHQWVYTQIDGTHFVIPLVVDIVFLAGILLLGYNIDKKHTSKRSKQYLFFLIWFLVGMLFHLQILPLDATVADRWFYFPIVGIVGMLGVAFEGFHLDLKKVWIVLLAISILVVFSARTVVRSFDWRDDFTTITHDLKVSPESYNLEGELSYLSLQRGMYQEAKDHAQKSLLLAPNTPNYINLAVAETHLHEYKQAKVNLMDSLKLGDSYITYEDLSTLALLYGDPQESISFIKNIALKKYPQDWKIWLNLAELEYNVGEKGNAKADITQAYGYNQKGQVSQIYNAIMHNVPIKIK